MINMILRQRFNLSSGEHDMMWIMADPEYSTKESELMFEYPAAKEHEEKTHLKLALCISRSKPSILYIKRVIKT